MLRQRIEDSSIAAAVAGGLTAIWFGGAVMRFARRSLGSFLGIPPWDASWVMEVWCPVASSATAALLLWLALSYAGHVPSVIRGVAAGVGTVFLAPYLCLRVFWGAILTFKLLAAGNLSGLIAMMTHEGSWPISTPIAAAVGGLLGWSLKRRAVARSQSVPAVNSLDNSSAAGVDRRPLA